MNETYTSGAVMSDELMKLLHRLHSAAKRRPPAGDPEAARPPEQEHRCGLGRGRIIDAVMEHGRISQGRLAQLLDIRPQSLSEAVQRLVDENMLEKEQNDLDKREYILCLTPLARRQAEKMREERVRFAERFFSPLSNEEKTELYALLSKLAASQKSESGEAKGEDKI